MSHETERPAEAVQELSEILQIRRDKLSVLQQEGRDPFRITRFERNAYSADIKADYEAYQGKTVTVA